MYYVMLYQNETANEIVPHKLLSLTLYSIASRVHIFLVIGTLQQNIHAE